MFIHVLDFSFGENPMVSFQTYHCKKNVLLSNLRMLYKPFLGCQWYWYTA